MPSDIRRRGKSRENIKSQRMYHSEVLLLSVLLPKCSKILPATSNRCLGFQRRLEKYHFNSVFEVFRGLASYTQGFRSIHNTTAPRSEERENAPFFFFNHYSSFALWSTIERDVPPMLIFFHGLFPMLYALRLNGGWNRKRRLLSVHFPCPNLCPVLCLVCQEWATTRKEGF